MGVKTFSFTGQEQVFTVPADGTYRISATGAGGSGGNTFFGEFTASGGRGAKISAAFTLKRNDVLHLVVGGRGTSVQATAKDGAAGGGGGGTFVFREISAITDSRYQFEKKGLFFEALLVAAGGGGSRDASYRQEHSQGFDGNASAAHSLHSNYVAYSIKTADPEAQTGNPLQCLGIAQYQIYDAAGSRYIRNNGVSQGGYGCGGSADDKFSHGGGWYITNDETNTHSWSLTPDFTGEDGVNPGDGRCTISGDAITGDSAGGKPGYAAVNGAWRRIRQIYLAAPSGAGTVWARVSKVFGAIGGAWRMVFSLLSQLRYQGDSKDGTVAPLSEGGRYVSSAPLKEYVLFHEGYGELDFSRKVSAYNRQLVRSAPTPLSMSQFYFAGGSNGRDALFYNGDHGVAYSESLLQHGLTTGNNMTSVAAASLDDRVFYMDGQMNTGCCFDGNLLKSGIGGLSMPGDWLGGARSGEYALFGGGENSEVVDVFDSAGVRQTTRSLGFIGKAAVGVGDRRYAVFMICDSLYQHRLVGYDKQLVATSLGVSDVGCTDEGLCSATCFAEDHMITGGKGTVGSPSGAVQIWDRNMTARQGISLHTPRSGHGTGTVGSYLLVAGGSQTAAYDCIDNVEVFKAE